VVSIGHVPWRHAHGGHYSLQFTKCSEANDITYFNLELLPPCLPIFCLAVVSDKKNIVGHITSFTFHIIKLRD